MSDEFVSKLPVYQTNKSKDFPSFLIVTCGYEDCPGTAADRPFLVSAKEWLRPRRVTSRTTGKVTVLKGRSCPYCFRVGRIPSRTASRA
jgi:hypothetical protein